MSFARAKYSDYEFSFGLGFRALSTHKHKPIEINSELKYKRGFKVRLGASTQPGCTPHEHELRYINESSAHSQYQESIRECV
jgi:hypothetical protein